MDQIWKDIPGFEGKYQASDDGQICRFSDHYVLALIAHPRGYWQVSLATGHQGGKKMLVHRLVALAFLGEPTVEDAVVNHKDGDKHHNQWTNLEWLTQGANVEHACRMRQTRNYRAEVRAHQEDPIPW